MKKTDYLENNENMNSRKYIRKYILEVNKYGYKHCKYKNNILLK